eukprot:1246226-Amphidinium_carterae.1
MKPSKRATINGVNSGKANSVTLCLWPHPFKEHWLYLATSYDLDVDRPHHVQVGCVFVYSQVRIALNVFSSTGLGGSPAECCYGALVSR